MVQTMQTAAREDQVVASRVTGIIERMRVPAATSDGVAILVALQVNSLWRPARLEQLRDRGVKVALFLCGWRVCALGEDHVARRATRDRCRSGHLRGFEDALQIHGIAKDQVTRSLHDACDPETAFNQQC